MPSEMVVVQAGQLFDGGNDGRIGRRIVRRLQAVRQSVIVPYP